ncbi:methylamine utilization protein [Rhodoferax sp. AJA081-3]|uniref:methylamine utilization protein n=1 Tax=Rhodoferax sp. AJA081-3 TaxID=2752316 RepID=UPI001ADF782D|nr:methylamine utilization protein [Rhodoferax sp. AJA081-3]QTN26465.1 methylamine utilization protein [Rhodoferax sp. AJA081-3]
MQLNVGFLITWALVVPLAQAATVAVQVQDGAGKPLPGAVVFLESREARQLAKPLAGAEIAQVGRQFVPRVLVVPAGTAVTFPNRDTVRHHVYSFSPNKQFELKLYTGTAANPVVFDKPGIAVLGCNIHDNMSAWVVVVETPFYASADPQGATSLRDVPAGNYRMRVWHPGLAVGAPAAEQALVVSATDVALTYRLGGVTP